MCGRRGEQLRIVRQPQADQYRRAGSIEEVERLRPADVLLRQRRAAFETGLSEIAISARGPAEPTQQPRQLRADLVDQRQLPEPRSLLSEHEQLVER